MKRAGYLYPVIAEPENLRLAFRKAQKGKQDRQDVRRFRANLEQELARLREELLRERVVVGEYHYFTVHDPKERRICAASFRQRVLHHAIMNVCEPVFERYAIHDSYACRAGKGNHAAVRRAQCFAKRFSYCLKLDVAKYFDSVDHSVLLRLLARRFKDRQLLTLFSSLLNSYETEAGKGLPIGNLTSQHFANYYLGLLDHHVKECMRIGGYARYMDDFLLWSATRAELKMALTQVRDFVGAELHLTLKPPQLHPVGMGVTFLGFRVFPHRIALARGSRRRFAAKLRRYERSVQEGAWSEEEYSSRLQSLVAFTLLANASGFRRALVDRFGVLS